MTIFDWALLTLDCFSSGLGGLLVGLLVGGLLVGLLLGGLLVGLLVGGLLVGLLVGGLLVGLLVGGLLVGLLLGAFSSDCFLGAFFLDCFLVGGLLVGLRLGSLLVEVLGGFLGWLRELSRVASRRLRAFWGCFSVASCLDCFLGALSAGFSAASSFLAAQKAAFFSSFGLLFLLSGSASWAAFRLFQDDCSGASVSSSSCVSRRRLGPGVGER